MDRTNGRFAYRCLPLTIANSHGWEVLSPCTFEAIWTGRVRARRGAVHASRTTAMAPLPDSQFGEGIIHLPAPAICFRTEPGYNMYVTGTPSTFAGTRLWPLSAVVETDWLPFPFTMNWAFHARPAVPIRFDKGEPFCHIFPVAKSSGGKKTQPEICGIETNPDLHGRSSWRGTSSRQAFLQELQRPGRTH